MSNASAVECVDVCRLSPEEQLTRCVANALKESGFPPLQYLDVKAHDGHVYLSARVPTLFLARRGLGVENKAAWQAEQDDSSLVTFVPY